MKVSSRGSDEAGRYLPSPHMSAHQITKNLRPLGYYNGVQITQKLPSSLCYNYLMVSMYNMEPRTKQPWVLKSRTLVRGLFSPSGSDIVAEARRLVTTSQMASLSLEHDANDRRMLSCTRA